MRHWLASEKRSGTKSRGWVGADRLVLWGFEAIDRLGFRRTSRTICILVGRRGLGLVICDRHASHLADADTVCTALLWAHGKADQVASGIASDGIPGFGLWHARHAAVLAGPGGALGCRSGASVSTMINRPPQQGHVSVDPSGKP